METVDKIVIVFEIVLGIAWCVCASMIAAT